MGSFLFPFLRYSSLRNSLCLSIFLFSLLRWLFVVIIVGSLITSYFVDKKIDKLSLPTEILLSLTFILLNIASSFEKKSNASSITPEIPLSSTFCKSERNYGASYLILLTKIENNPCSEIYMKIVVISYECACWGSLLCVFTFVNDILILHKHPYFCLIKRVLQISIILFDILIGTIVLHIRHIVFTVPFVVLLYLYLYIFKIFKEILIFDLYNGDFSDYFISISFMIILSIFIHILLSIFTNWKFERYDLKELSIEK